AHAAQEGRRLRVVGEGLLGREYQAERGVVLAQAVEPVARALLAIVLAQRLAERAERIDDPARPHRRPPAGDLVHEVVDVLQLAKRGPRSEEHTSELQSLTNLVCRLLLEKKN